MSSIPPFTQQLDEWERATRERYAEAENRAVDRGVKERATQSKPSAGSQKARAAEQRSAKRKQAKDFKAALRPTTQKEKELDRLEQKVHRAVRELGGTIAGSAASTIVSSHKDKAQKAKNRDWQDGTWGIGFGSSWINDRATEAANEALGRPKGQKAMQAELDDPRSAFSKAFWTERKKIAAKLQGLHEMNCLTMMEQSLDAYAGAEGKLERNEEKLKQKLTQIMKKAKDARSVAPKEVADARGTVVLEELRKQLDFQTVHIDAVPEDPKKYWNNQEGWNYSSDADARHGDHRLPKSEAHRTVEGADTHKPVDVSVGLDHFVKLTPKMSAESRQWWKTLNETEFAVGVADQGFHTFAISRGFVYEVHWDRGPDDPTLTGKRSLKSFFDPNQKGPGFGWSSGIIALPPGALPDKPE